MPSDKPKKKTQPPDIRKELRENLNKVYPTLIAGTAEHLTEKEALEVAVPVLESICAALRDRLEELKEEGT